MGEDTNSRLNLWVTDGTVAGTSEVQVANASSSGLLYNRAPDFTVLGNSKVVFAGNDNNSKYSLWVTAGTSELTSTSAYANGLFYYSVSPEFTALGNGKAVFEGNDVLNHLNLRVTDGTSAGTSELTAGGAGANGLFLL